MPHNKKIALVTGASSGIGKALSQELVSKNWIVLGLARRADQLNDIRNHLGNAFIPIPCDVANPENMRNASQNILNQGLLPSVFFLNAGLAGQQALENPETFVIELHERIMAVNYFGVLAFVEFFAQPCVNQGGAHFIVTNSVTAIFPPPLCAAYAASKAAIAKAFDCLSMTYFGKNLRFSSIYTGPVATNALSTPLPFTWSPEKMAKYMVRFSGRQKSRGYPSLFYTLICYFLRILPTRLLVRILKKK